VRKLATRQLVREYVRSILSEDDAYGGMDLSSNGSDSPFGASFGSDKDLYNVFVKPFTDVVSTTAGKAKELSQRGQTLAKVAFEAIATSLIPILEDDYEDIFKKEDEALGKLKAQYKDIYDSTWTAFKDNDIVTAAFMYAPSAMITAKIAQQTPIQTIKVLNILTGGNLDNFLSRVTKKLKLGDTKKPLDHDSGEGLPEGVIRELHSNPQQKLNIGAILTQKKVKQAIDNNPKVEQMSAATKKTLENSLNQVLLRVNAISTSKNIQELETKLGKKFKGVDKLAQVPQQERQALEQTLLKGLKQSALTMYSKGINQQVQKAMKAGVPEDHPYVKLLQTVLSKLKSA
jgi:hypothetical protein